MAKVTCSACGRQIGRGPGGLGLISHWRKHRREYFEEHGEWPCDAEGGRISVREWLGGPTDESSHEQGIDEDQVTLTAFAEA